LRDIARRANERADLLEVERDLYRGALEAFVATFKRRQAPSENVSPWDFVERFERVLEKGLLSRPGRPVDGPGAEKAPEGSPP
jgi:hypothetical protein